MPTSKPKLHVVKMKTVPIDENIPKEPCDCDHDRQAHAKGKGLYCMMEDCKCMSFYPRAGKRCQACGAVAFRKHVSGSDECRKMQAFGKRALTIHDFNGREYPELEGIEVK